MNEFTTAIPTPPARRNTATLRRLGIDTYQEAVIYMPSDCAVCRSEGFESQSRIEVRLGGRSITATLNAVTQALLGEGEASLSESAWRTLGAREGDEIEIAHAAPLESLSFIRAKVYGRRLDQVGMDAIVRDIVAGRYSDLHLSAFLTACADERLDADETIALTRAMVAVGDRLHWSSPIVVDKHCVGGLPGNRTTLILVPIVAACGLTIPKTSSRAITSPAGTADTMETLAPVNLGIPAIRRVVERTGGCIVWGGAVRLSPADDVLIRVERPLDLDSEGQLVASVMSKKAAAGSTHVVIDLPVGPTAKVRSAAAAQKLIERLQIVGDAIGIHTRFVLSDGTQPVGRGIGPALEARDVLAVLRNEAGAPLDLRDRSLRLAGEILEMAGKAAAGQGHAMAADVLASGRAWTKFHEICEAQGGLREPAVARHRQSIVAARAGRVAAIDNRLLSRVAKLAGAPSDPTAGVELHTPVGEFVERGQALYTVHSDAPGELAYALDYVGEHSNVINIQD
jgi:thymidine phosphorylase